MNSWILHAAALATSVMGQVCFAQYIEPAGSLVPQSAKRFLRLDTPMTNLEGSSNAFWVTGLYTSNLTATVNANTLLMLPNNVCSAYDNVICHRISNFYTPTNTPFIATGIWRLSKNTIVHLGLNTGFQSAKLTVSPALFLGFGQRFFLDSKRLSHIVIEGSTWAGSKVGHKPCIDDYQREYFCGNLTAWSDYRYQEKPHSYSVKIWYERRF